MNLGQLKQIVDKALEERPTLKNEGVFFFSEKKVTPIGGLVLNQYNELRLCGEDCINKETIWLP